MAAGYLFLLGLASGIALLAVSAYRRVTPAWLRGLLIGSGLLMIGRYVAMALGAGAGTAEQVRVLHPLWFGGSIGLTLPSVFAVDQLVRHPAMTPKKLLWRYAPFLVIYAAIQLMGASIAAADAVAGWRLRLIAPWRIAASITQGAFAIGFIGLCGLLIAKIPVRPIRLALGGLALAQAWLGLDGVIAPGGGWLFGPFPFSEMAVLLAIWHAYETAKE